ncbi:MAG: 4,5-DOPA dioxygenase extradiol [Actinomycetes bacterium]
MNARRQPAAFIGHGNPMNTFADNTWTRAWRAFGQRVARPRAILIVSAHWYIGTCAVTAMDRPRTIHDFGGFPQALFDLQYPAPGEPGLAAEVIELLDPIAVTADTGWGLDHGTWSVLAHVVPDADVPIVQLSIDATQSLAHHIEVGRQLAPLRDDGVLLIGSGNIVHNIGRADFGSAGPFDWNVRFDAHIQRALEHHDEGALIDYNNHPDGLLAVPTPDHYIPLLTIAGSRVSGDSLSVLTHGYDAGSLSMRSIVYS